MENKPDFRILRIKNVDVRTIPTTEGNFPSKIYSIDTGLAEAIAMFQALVSRNNKGVEVLLDDVNKKNPEAFMETYYLGYGHKSIGDLADMTLFFEYISMLAAKAIQDYELYRGQESSTRYIDFSKQPILNPLGTIEGSELQEMQRRFYLYVTGKVIEHLKRKYPLKDKENEKMYNRAINARAFDITRSFLPAGTSTIVAWTGSLRGFNDRLLWLRHHPLEEVKLLSYKLEDLLISLYPNSFNRKRYEDTENYQDKISEGYYYHNPESERLLIIDGLNHETIKRYSWLLNSRPEKTELPEWLKSELGIIEVEYLLDFGSFRDLQRHRSLHQRMPLLTTEIGFEEWYLKQLGELNPELRTEAETHLEDVVNRINNLNAEKTVEQYYIPMGYMVSGKFSATVPSAVYVAELRSGRRVHPTLRPLAQEIGNYLREKGIRVHVDESPDQFYLERGKDTIEKRE